MMISRRGFIGVGIGAGRILTPVTTKVARAKSRYAEIEARIAAKDFLGLSKEDLPTPCILVDQAIFEQNLRTMAVHSRATGLKIRPHVKIHKCVEIAKRQIVRARHRFEHEQDALLHAHAGLNALDFVATHSRGSPGSTKQPRASGDAVTAATS